MSIDMDMEMSSMEEVVKELLTQPIILTIKVIKSSDESSIFKQESLELKSRAEKLLSLLHAAYDNYDLFEPPTRRIISCTEIVIKRALSLVSKCKANGSLTRFFTIIPAAQFRKLAFQLENSIADVSWLLQVSASVHDRDDPILGMPPIAANDPILCLIWEQIAVLYTGSTDDRTDAAASLVSLARDNVWYVKLIIAEGGVGPLLKLANDGNLEGQENAARAIGYLGSDPESVEHIVKSGVCEAFAKILKYGAMKVQAVVAWAVAELAAHNSKCQTHFAEHNVVRSLVSHLAFMTILKHGKYDIVSKKTSIHAVVLAKNIRGSNKVANNGDSCVKLNNVYHSHNQSLSVASHNTRDMNDPGTKTYMKAMAARAIWNLAKGNSAICGSITAWGALSCFAFLLEKGEPDVQYNSAMALMEITAVAEEDAELRRSAFNSGSSACKAVVDQLLRIVELADSELLIPCIKAIGNLARTFRATETRMISPLVRLLDEKDGKVTREACIALTKFACTGNYVHNNHCKSIIRGGRAKQIVRLVYFCEQIVQRYALILLCYIALHAPDSEEIAQAEVLTVLEWALKQSSLIKHEGAESLIISAGGVKHIIQLVHFGKRIVQGYALILLCYIALDVPDIEVHTFFDLAFFDFAMKQASLISDEGLMSLAKALSLLRGSRGYH